MMDGILRDLRYAIRGLVRMRGGAAIAIAALALGIGATTTMFAVVYAALVRPLPFDEPERLVMLYVTRATPKEGLVRLRWSRPVLTHLDRTTSFDAIASFSAATIAVSGDAAAPEQVDGEIVSPLYFRTLHVAPEAGRAFLAEEDAAPG